MIICSCSNISDKDSKETVIEKVKNTKTNCKQCPLFTNQLIERQNKCQLKT